MYAGKFEGEVYNEDIILICTKIIFKIPIRQGEIKTLSKIEFEQMKTLPLPPPPMSTGAEKIMINLEDDHD